jgi:D-alanyl-D-alanine carboxypeptidase
MRISAIITRTIAFYIIVTLATIVSFSQSTNLLKLDSLFAVLTSNNKAMGSIVISKNQQIVYKNTIGYSLYSNQKKILATEGTKYRIGSISKMFTAVIIFQLIEEGKITLGTTLEKYFPQLPNSKLITIENLLSHKSGIPNIKNIRGKGKSRTNKEMLKIISRKKEWTLPDTSSLYSNSNFLLLGYIIEKITGKSYAEVLSERITSKIGLKDTYVGERTDIENDESFSYRLKRKWKKQRQTNLSIPGASAGIVSTPTALARFIEALFCYKLVNPNSLETMKTVSNKYGMGLFHFKLDTKKAFGHPGGIDRFESVVAYFPDDSLAIAYCSNGQVYPVKDIVIASLNIYFGKNYLIPDFKPVVIRPDKLKKYEGIYCDNQIPFKIIVDRHKKKLFAKLSEYSSSYDLYPVSLHKFKCDEVNVIIEFDPFNNEMKLNLDGRIVNLKKEK